MMMRALFIFSLLLIVHHCNCSNNAYFIKTSVPYVIDGNSSDWIQNTATHPITDTSYQVLGNFKAGYDEKNIYFLITVTDGSPLANAASSANFQQAIYTGAGISICFGSYNGAGTNQRIVLFKGSDNNNQIFVMRPSWPDSSSHPYSYFTTASGDYLVDYEWFLGEEGASVALEEAPGGWIAEALIPWSVLQYTAGDGSFIPFDIEILVPGPSGSTLQEAGWWYSKGPATATEDIVVQAKLYPNLWGQALMSINNVGPQPSVLPPVDPAFSPYGLPISFVIPVSETVGVTVNVIDETSGWVYRELVRAKLMTKGDYTIYWDGFDREGKIVPAGKYRVVVAYYPPLNTTYAGSVGNSGRPPFPTSDGMGSLGGVHYGPCAVAADDTGVYQMNTVEEGFGGLRKIDPFTGEPLWVASIGMFEYSSTLAVEEGIICTTSYSDSSPSLFSLLCFNSSSGKPSDSLSNLDCPLDLARNASGMAILNSTVYISVPGYLLVATPTAKKSEWIQNNISIDGLVSICRFNFTHLIIISNNSLFYYEVSSGSTTLYVSMTNSSPLVCTTQGDNGDVFVSDSVQVTKYNNNGEVELTIGTPGGRPLAANPYVPNQLKNVLYLAVGPDDNVYMAERQVAPFRYAVFSSFNGSWIRDYYGPIGYETVVVDRDDVSNVYFLQQAAYPWLIQTKVNYEAYAKDPSDSLNGFSVSAIHLITQNGKDESVVPDIVNNNTWGKVNDGQKIKYMFLSGYRRGSCLLFNWDLTNRFWKPIVAYNSIPSSISQFLIWLDINHNGLVDNNEYFPANPNVTHNIFYAIDKNLNLYSQRYKLSPSSIDEQGLPRYDSGSLFDFLYSPDSLNWNDYFDSWEHSNYPSSTPSTSEDASYAALSFGPSGDTAFWDRSSVARIIKFANGTAQWIIGHKDASLSNNGDSMMLETFAGEADGIACVGEIISNFHCFSSDGLSLGWLLIDGGGNMANIGYNAITIENAGQASFFINPLNGSPILFSLTTGDLRILNVVGPFGGAIVREYQEVMLNNPFPRLTGTVPQARAYDLQYLTQGTGSNGYFYITLPYTDAWDWEWVKEVPALTISGNEGNIITEVRLRRDAGELNVFADVLGGSFPYFPPNSSSFFNLSSLFGTTSGVEVLIGPTPTGRREGERGDTRILLTAVVKESGQYEGYAFACRPSSPPVNASFLRPQDIYGNYTGHPNITEMIDFSKLTLIPGAIVAVLPRPDKKGYRLEASIPLSLLPEITSIQPVTFRRFNHGIPTGSVAAMYTDNRADFSSSSFPLSFNVAVYYPNNNATATRYPWVEDGFTGTDPTVMNPSLWGVIESPATLLLYTVEPSNVTFEYASTTIISVDFHNVPSLSASPTALAGGAWFGPTSSSPSFSSPSPAPGFSVTYVSGLGTFVNWIGQFMRFVPLFDSSPWGLSYPLDSAGGGHPNTSSSIFFNITTSFNNDISGELHILWGDFTSNTFTGCYLNITDEKEGETISGLMEEYEEYLQIKREYNAGGQVRETIIRVGGSSSLSVSLTNPYPQNVGSYIQAIWIEPVSPSAYTSPANITLLCQVVRTSLIIDSISFFNQNNLIGSSSPNSPVPWLNVNAGQYQIVAVGTDKYTGQSNSSLVSINVYGPVVTLSSPLNSSSVSNPVTIQLAVSENGPTGNVSVVSVSLSSGQNFKITDSPWFINVGDLPEGIIGVDIIAVDTNGYYSNFQYSFVVTSSLSAVDQATKKKITIV